MVPDSEVAGIRRPVEDIVEPVGVVSGVGVDAKVVVAEGVGLVSCVAVTSVSFIATEVGVGVSVGASFSARSSILVAVSAGRAWPGR